MEIKTEFVSAYQINECSVSGKYFSINLYVSPESWQDLMFRVFKDQSLLNRFIVFFSQPRSVSFVKDYIQE